MYQGELQAVGQESIHALSSSPCGALLAVGQAGARVHILDWQRLHDQAMAEGWALTWLGGGGAGLPRAFMCVCCLGACAQRHEMRGVRPHKLDCTQGLHVRMCAQHSGPCTQKQVHKCT